jgi:FKBP-type peptidyl-prolyl cis-trans isomerase FkpA
MKTISLHVFLACLVLIGAVSCTNSGFKKTKSGLLYKIYSDGKGPLATKGQFLKMNIVEKIRDSILYSSQGNMPIYLPVDSSKPVYSPLEVFAMLRKGDSAVTVMLVDTLLRRQGGQPPAWMKRKDKMTFTFKVMDVFASEDAMNRDRSDELAKQRDREAKEVEGYLSSNKIQAEKTAKGTYVVIQSEGDGPQVDSGKQVAVRYTGKLLPSGKVFQSNMTGPGTDPIKFVIGQGQIIPGWDDGLRKFKKGGKGTLYIPAFLAYDQQLGPGRKPFENLMFDVEVVDVTDAPKTTGAMPGGPGMMRMRPGQMMARPQGAPGSQPQQQGQQVKPQQPPPQHK